MKTHSLSMKFISGLSIAALILSLLPVGAIKQALAATPIVTIVSAISNVNATSRPTYQIVSDQDVALTYFGCDTSTLTLFANQTATLTLDPLADGVYACKLLARNLAHEYTSLIDLGTFIVDVAPFDISLPGYAGDLVVPSIAINAPTLTSATSINDTIVTVTDNAGITAANVVVSGATTVVNTSFNCLQTSATQVDCSVSITGTPSTNFDTFVIEATDDAGNKNTNGVNGYDITTSDVTVPVVAITGATLTSAAATISETITVTDDTGINASDIIYSPSSTATIVGGSLLCAPASGTTINCTVTVNGDGNLIIRATDQAGNQSTDSAVYNVNADMIPPVVTIGGLLKNSSSAISETITITDNVGLQANAVTIGGGTTSPYSNLTCTQTNATTVNCNVTILNDGQLEIFADDSAGNSASDLEAGYVITGLGLDSIAPVVTITPPVSKTGSSPLLGTTITVTDETAITSTNVFVSGISTATTQAINCLQTNATTVTCTVNITGSGDLVIVALDDNTNLGTDVETGYVITGLDNVSPVLAQVTAVPTPTTNTTPSYTFSSNEVGTINYGGDCTSATTNAVAGNNTITLTVTPNLGIHTNCYVTVTDAATNVSNQLFLNAFTIVPVGADLTAPVLAQVAAVTPNPTTDTTPDYTFSSTEAGTITYAGDCSSATTVAVAGNNTVTFNALALGLHNNCTITVTDAALNVSTALVVVPFTINPISGSGDVTPPVVAEQIAVVNPTGDSTPNYTFTSNEVGTYSFLSGCGAANGNGGAVSIGSNIITFSPALADASYNVCVIAVSDLSGNTSNLAVTPFTVNTLTGPTPDTTAPVISVFAPTKVAVASITDTVITVTDAGGLTATNISILGASTVTTSGLTCLPATGTTLTCSLNINTTVNPGNLVIRAIDDASNSTTFIESGYSITLLGGDVTPPTVTETVPVPTPTQDTTPSITFFTNEAGTITLSGGCTSPATLASIGWNTITLNPLPNGVYNCTVTVTDASGNATALVLSPFTINTTTGNPVDATAPVITLVAPTKTNVGPITNTTISITDNAGILPSDVFVGTSTTVTYTNFLCVATSATAVNCTIQINSSGTLEIRAYDTSSNFSTVSEFGYTITTPTSGGGGGGAGFCNPEPTGTIVINNGDEVTKTLDVKLSLTQQNSTGYMASENINFPSQTFMSFEDTRIFPLSSSVGQKTVYAIFRNHCGFSVMVSDTIYYDPNATSTNPSKEQPADTGHLGREEDVNGLVLGELNFADGTLIRDFDTKRIYVIIDGMKRYISSLAELQNLYAGVSIINLDGDIVKLIPNFIDLPGQVLGDKEYADGVLLRDPAKHIYVIESQMKRHIQTLDELRSEHFGVPIINVSYAVLDAYPELYTKNVFNEGDLIRGTNMKVYVIENGKKVHIPTLTELNNNYLGQPIYNVGMNVLNMY